MRSLFTGPLRVQSVDGTAVANTTTETIVFPNLVLPTEFMLNHRRLKFEAAGKISSTGSPTITFRNRFGATGVGGTLIGLTEALTAGAGLVNAIWRIKGTIQARADGSTGKLLLFGEVSLHTAAGTLLKNVYSISGFDAPAEVTVDLLAAAELALTAQWNVADVANTLTGMDYCVEVVN